MLWVCLPICQLLRNDGWKTRSIILGAYNNATFFCEVVNGEGRPHMFENTGFKVKFGEPRYKNVGLDTCLTSRSWVLNLVPLLLGTIVRFQLQSKTAVLQGLEPLVLIGVENGRFNQ